MGKLPLLLIGLSVASLSCSRMDDSEEGAELSNVVSPQNGATAYYYWQEQTDTVRGTCSLDKPLNRGNCSTNMIKRPTTTVTTRANASAQRILDNAIAAVAAEVKFLKDGDPTVQSLTAQIASMTQQKNSMQNLIQTETTQIDNDIKLKTTTTDQLTALRKQLADIEKQLQTTPNDPTLIAKRDQTKMDIAAAEDKIRVLTDRLVVTQDRLAKRKTALAALEPKLVAKQNEFKRVYDDLNVYSPKLEQLVATQSDAQAVLKGVQTVLNSISKATINYRSQIWTKDLQQALTFIDTAIIQGI